MTDVLVGVWEGVRVGELRRGRGGLLTFTYGEAWLSSPASFPLTLSCPVDGSPTSPDAVRNYLWGLLPDRDATVARWAGRFGVSARDPFALIAHTGDDCPGAVRFVTPARVGRPEPPGAPAWLDDDAIATRLEALERDPSAWHGPAPVAGYFSLSGAQPKIALVRRDGRWADPSDETPTTHILKPPSPDFDGFAQNEHLCLALARRLGLSAARSEVRTFGGQIAIVVERYDRYDAGDRIARVHQEDVCQALGVHPRSKYEADGGPGAEETADLLRSWSMAPMDDVRRLIGALGLAWLIGATDLHAKNVSVLHGPGHRTLLAPLYDLASALPYFHRSELQLAMKVGGEYRVEWIRRRHWERLAAAVKLKPADVVELIAGLADRLPGAMEEVVAEARAAGLEHPSIDPLVDRILAHAERCRGWL